MVHNSVYCGVLWYDRVVTHRGCTTVYHGIPWYTMVYHGTPWYTCTTVQLRCVMTLSYHDIT